MLLGIGDHVAESLGLRAARLAGEFRTVGNTRQFDIGADHRLADLDVALGGLVMLALDQVVQSVEQDQHLVRLGQVHVDGETVVPDLGHHTLSCFFVNDLFDVLGLEDRGVEIQLQTGLPGAAAAHAADVERDDHTLLVAVCRQQRRGGALDRLEVILHHEVVEVGIRSGEVGPHVLDHDNARVVVVLVIGNLFVAGFHGVDREFIIHIRTVHGERNDIVGTRRGGIFHIEFLRTDRDRHAERAGHVRFEEHIFEEQRIILAVLLRIDRDIGRDARLERQVHTRFGGPVETGRHDRNFGCHNGFFRCSGDFGSFPGGVDVGTGAKQDHRKHSTDREDFFHNASN